MSGTTRRLWILVAGVAAGCHAGAAPAEVPDAGSVDVRAPVPVVSPIDCPAGAVATDGACKCPLNSLTPTACPDVCTDLASDGDNCGACGHACPATAPCVRGVCRALATTILPATSDCVQLSVALADGVLYWTSLVGGTVQSARVDGSSRRTITSGESYPGPLVVNGSTLLWIATSGTLVMGDGGAQVSTTIRKATLPDGAPTDLVTEVNDAPGIAGLAVSGDGATLYYSVGKQVKAVPVAGGLPTVIAEDMTPAQPSAIVVDGTTLIYVSGAVELVSAVDGAIASCFAPPPNVFGGPPPVAGVNCVSIGSSNNPLGQALALRAGNVYWAGGGGVMFARTTPDGTSAARLVARANGIVKGLATGRDAVYFVDGDRVERATYGVGSEAIPIARGQTPTGSIVLDETRVYWSNVDCSIAAASLE
jgi:hypothetical protein